MSFTTFTWAFTLHPPLLPGYGRTPLELRTASLELGRAPLEVRRAPLELKKTPLEPRRAPLELMAFQELKRAPLELRRACIGS